MKKEQKKVEENIGMTKSIVSKIGDEMKIALCISGQMRTFRECYKNLNKNIINKLKPDIFIHTWKYSGITTKASKDEKGEEITYDLLNELYTPKKAVIEEFKKEYSQEINGIKIPKILIEKREKFYKGQLPMFYKMYECNKLKFKYEKENNFKYDAVIRLRPDLKICGKLPKKIFKQLDVIWTEGIADKRYRRSDRFAISNSSNIDYYVSVWEHLNEYWEKPLGDGKVTNYRMGGQLMKHHAKQSNIEWRLFYIPCYTIRKEMLEKHLFNHIYYFKRYSEMIARNMLEKYVR